MRTSRGITYYAQSSFAPQDGYRLTAKTDTGARRQARAIAKKHGWECYRITFYRDSDGGRGQVDI